MYNLGLVVILIIFLLFALGTGKSMGDMFCAKADEDKRDATMAFIFNLMFAGTFGYWAYHEYSENKRTRKNIIKAAKNISLDPNMILDDLKIEQLDFDQLLVESLSESSDGSELIISESDNSELEFTPIDPNMSPLSDADKYKAIDKGSGYGNIQLNYEEDEIF